MWTSRGRRVSLNDAEKSDGLQQFPFAVDESVDGGVEERRLERSGDVDAGPDRGDLQG
ncbi:hypothetical protein [Nocardioides convexus]|uniref:hypothetical protein n=1 Tax=Nocardioides convexus TaxID=2712224 RepID=UPI002418BBF0|nr:hypothetical protein [Nocardioides convexus]